MQRFLEEIIHCDNNDENFSVQSVGITFPDPNYVIQRTINSSNLIVAEYISSGCGYLEINGKTYFLKKGDCYVIPNNTNHKYYSTPSNPFTKKWVNVSGEIAYRLLNYYLGGISPIIAPVDISSEIDEIHAVIKRCATATFSDFRLTAKNTDKNLLADIHMGDWNCHNRNGGIKASKNSRYGGFAVENYSASCQNLFLKLPSLRPNTEYTLSFSVKSPELYGLEVLSTESGDKLPFKKSADRFSFEAENIVGEWTDLSLSFKTTEAEGRAYYFNIHYGTTSFTKEALLCFHNILSKIATEIYKSAPSVGMAPTAEQIRLYIEEHTGERLTMDALSKKFYLSPSHIDRIFKKSFACSPYQYYLECKMRLAKRQLSVKDLSIQQISENLNFSSRSHFERSFLKITGETPAAYRKSI